MLIAGYDSEFEVQYTGPIEIPANAAFVASVALNEIDAPLVTLRSSAGDIIRVSSVVQASGNWLTIFRFKFSGDITGDWRGKTLFADMVRTDNPRPEPLGFRIQNMRFHAPITRPSHLSG